MVLKTRTRTLRANLSELVSTVIEEKPRHWIPREHTNIALVDSNDRVIGEVILTRIRVGTDEANSTMESATGYIVIDEDLL